VLKFELAGIEDLCDMSVQIAGQVSCARESIPISLECKHLLRSVNRDPLQT
jgi:hypothetical protein